MHKFSAILTALKNGVKNIQAAGYNSMVTFKTLIGIGQGTYSSIFVAFLENMNFTPIVILRLNLYQKFQNFFEVKIGINGVNLTPCQAH